MKPKKPLSRYKVKCGTFVFQRKNEKNTGPSSKYKANCEVFRFLKKKKQKIGLRPSTKPSVKLCFSKKKSKIGHS
jgi:hypothetical protein